MTTSQPRLSSPSLLAAAALVIMYAQVAVAQDAPRAAAVERAAAVKAEQANTPVKEAAPALKDAAAARPTGSAPEKCACESADEPDAAPSSPEPAAVRGTQTSAPAPTPSKPLAPELFTRGGQSTGTQQGGSNATPQWTPLTNEEKMKRAARNAFFNPIGVGRVLISSAITQYNEDDQPHKSAEDEFADFGTRFAINYSRRATRTLLGSGVYPILLNQDPRYDRAEEGKGMAARAAHAVSRVFVQRGDSGKVQPAVSRWAGSLSASALSNLWERSTPGHDRIGTDATFRRFGNSFINDSINFLFTEFWPDIAKIFRR